MKNSIFLRRFGLLLLIGAIVFGISFVNTFIYPFQTKEPNFSTIESVFNRMQFPAEWQEINSSENRGIGGRRCPIESASYCYHKSKTFSVPKGTSVDVVKSVLIYSNCPFVGVIENTTRDETSKSYSFECSTEGIKVSGSLRGPENEVYISTAS